MTTAVPTLNARTIVDSALYQDLLRQRDEARAALREIRDRHVHDEFMWCRMCGLPADCPDRQAADQALARMLPVAQR